jgi:hypothetical protein
VRRATPATLTGVIGRPTIASAVETMLKEPGLESLSAAPIPAKETTPVSSMILNVLSMVI